MRTRILVAAVALGIVGCEAQEGLPGAPATPGLPPVAIADIVSVVTDSTNNSIAALTNDIDLSGTGLTITAVTVDQTLPPMAGATATTNGTTVNFTPPATFIGVVTLNYDIIDGTGATGSGVIAVSVLPVALPPVAIPDTAMVMQDSGATDIDVIGNDIDFSGGGLDVTAVSVADSLPPAVHTVAIDVVDNEVRFTPAAAFTGVVVVNYTVTDGNGSTADGVLTIVVSPLALPTGPVPVPDAEVVAQDSGATDIDVLSNDVDPDGLGLTLTGVSVTSSTPAAVHTVAMDVADNEVRFTPAAGFTGVVLITYEATDDSGDSADGILTVVVSPLALPTGPVPLPDAAVLAQDSPATDIVVLSNDIDPDGMGLTLTDVSVTSSQPSAVHTVAIDAVDNEVRFTPATGFAGIVVVTYEATDDSGDSANGVLNIVVTPATPPVGPLAIPDVGTVAQDAGVTNFDVLFNDIDFAGDGLALTNAVVTSSQPAGTHAVGFAGDMVQFTPDPGFAGIVVVTYTAQDGDGLTSNGLLTITVTPSALQIPPLALPDMDVASSSAGPQSFDVMANDINPAGGGLTLTVDSLVGVPATGTEGTAMVVGGLVQYTPVVGYAGIVTITYTIEDVNGNTSTSTLTLTVTL